MDSIRIYILDDEKPITDGLKIFLHERGFDVETFNMPETYLHALHKQPADISLIDIRLPGMNGIEVLKRSKKIHPLGEAIMISAHGDIDDVIEAMREGAFDYIRKPFELRFVEQTIKKTNKYIAFRKKYDALQNKYQTILNRLNTTTNQKIIGYSPYIKQLLQQMNQVASSYDTSVLITGESGTGKELVAQGIHNLSQRKEHSFYPINMTAITTSLFESQMFGHKKGAFTGASSDKKGVLRTAHKGTVFLDEIGDMDADSQAKLLRFLEEKKVYPVGSEQSYQVDTRIIAATNRNLEDRIKKHAFREDLFYRLNVFKIELAPLRKRKEDIPVLFDYFVETLGERMKKTVTKTHKEVYDMISLYDYPGNIRELKNLTEHAIILSENGMLTPEHFPELMAKTRKTSQSEDANSTYNLEDLEKNTIRQALNISSNKSQAAKKLGITWQALDRKIKKYGL